jgi:small subunit ribosomal protein S21|tara:strand:+ start:1077 stop:1451 length:375 start_codon:yes stop_codon:yes gene_type:complete
MAYTRNQKHRNQSDTSARNHDSKKKHFKKRKKFTREDYQIPGCATGIKVPEGSSIDMALKRFKKMMKMTGIIDELKERKRYEKPSKLKYEARKRAKAIESNNTIRDIKRESKQCWTAILDGQAQ